MRYETVSSNALSFDTQVSDALNYLRVQWPETYAGIIGQFAEYPDLVWSGAWVDTDASGVDPDYMSHLADALEWTGYIMWDDGEPYGRPAPAGALWDAFHDGYVTGALWADVMDPETGESADVDYTPDDLTRDAAAALYRDAQAFYSENGALIGAFCRYLSRTGRRPLRDAYAVAGHDLWLTRNGHGAGFWDAGAGRVGDLLSDRAHTYGSAYLWADDDGRVSYSDG